MFGFKVNGRVGEGIEVSHLLFGYDIWCFVQIKKKYLGVLWGLSSPNDLVKLVTYVVWGHFGLQNKSNQDQAHSYGKGGELGWVSFWIGCKVGNLLANCLGLPLGDPHNLLGAWDAMEKRYHKRLAMWKKQYISKGGKLTLIQSTLSSLPICFISLFRMPRIVSLRLE